MAQKASVMVAEPGHQSTDDPGFVELPLPHVHEASAAGHSPSSSFPRSALLAEALTREDLTSFLESRLARFEIPRYVRFSPEPLPRIASGKILKRQLREEALTDMKRA